MTGRLLKLISIGYLWGLKVSFHSLLFRLAASHPGPSSATEHLSELLEDKVLYPLIKCFEIVLRQSPASEFDNILIVGCGFGGDEILLRRYFVASRLISLDISVERVRFVRSIATSRAATANWETVVANATKLPIRDESVDLVLCIEVIEHIAAEGQRVLAREISRVCKRGKFIIVSTPIRTGHGISPYRSQTGKMVVGPTHLHELEKPAKLIDLFAPDFQPIAVYTHLVPIPVVETFYRLLAKVGLCKLTPAFLLNHDPNLPDTPRLLRFVWGVRLFWPGWRDICLVAKRV